MPERVTNPPHTPDVSHEEHAVLDASAQRLGVWERARKYLRRHGITLVVTFLPSCVAGSYVSDELIDSRLPRGLHVLDVDVSRLERSAAQELIERALRKRIEQPVTLVIDGKRASLVPNQAGFAFDVQKSLDQALYARRGRGGLARFASWVRAWFGASGSEAAALRIEGAQFAHALDEIEQRELALPFAGGFHLEGGRIVPEYPRAGRALDRQLASERIRAQLLSGGREVVLPVRDVAAPIERAAIDQLVERARKMCAAELTLSDGGGARRLTLTANELASSLRVRAGATPTLYFDGEALLSGLAERRAALENPAKSARFVVHPDDRVEIVPSQPELRLAANSLGAAVEQAALGATRTGELPLERGAEPELSSEQAQALSIRAKVSSFTTRHPCCERRVDNIHRIADLLDGLVVKPGETVSVNAIIGPRTTKNGFVPAPTIEEGEMVETIGGGISQFATTFFNALFYGGYDIIERQPHTYWFPRYPMGHEATLSYPHPDLVFRNDTQAGMLIHTSYTEKSITVSIYGDNGGRRVRAEVSARQNIVTPPIEILPNPQVSPQKEHTLQAGMIGWSVIVGRVIQFPDGTKKEERRKVTYKPKVRRVEVHPCRVPEGEKGYTGERCPEPEDSGEDAEEKG